MTPDIHTADLYARLGVQRTATAQEIKRAYQRLVRSYPPERAPEEFKRIREAYETLSDTRSRSAHDRSPSPFIEPWIRQASDAMDAQEYSVAERYLQQVLIESPDLHFIRNLLGLCLLYQNRVSEAVAQYEQLTATGEPSDAWYGNLGHAYQRLGRSQDAIRAFQRAILVGEDVTSYYLGWADVLIQQERFDAAAKVLERAIQHDGQVDPADLQYFTRLLEVRIYQQNLAGLHADAARVESVAVDAEQRRYVAWKLGMLARQLLCEWHFESVIRLSQAARRLQPNDSDYEALERLATLLQQGRDDEAGDLMRWHRSFQQDGWLADLRRDVESSMPVR